MFHIKIVGFEKVYFLILYISLTLCSIVKVSLNWKIIAYFCS